MQQETLLNTYFDYRPKGANLDSRLHHSERNHRRVPNPSSVKSFHRTPTQSHEVTRCPTPTRGEKRLTQVPSRQESAQPNSQLHFVNRSRQSSHPMHRKWQEPVAHTDNTLLNCIVYKCFGSLMMGESKVIENELFQK